LMLSSKVVSLNGQTCSPTKDTTFDDNINPGDPSDNPALFPVGWRGPAACWPNA